MFEHDLGSTQIAARLRVIPKSPGRGGGPGPAAAGRLAGPGRALIHNAARGNPRAINNLAVNALTSAFARNSTIVDEKAARIAICETGAD